MNYFGKFDAKVSDALGHPGSHFFSETVHAAHAPSDAIVVPDAQLLFSAEFKRAGVDLVLSGDGREFVLHDYFKGEKHAPLASPDGAHLTGDIVTALAGQVQYAQAANSASANQIIGHVTKLAGTATAIRNGVSIILNNGDNVEKGDVVQSGSDSTLGITFIDGTVFGLSSNARMVLNEMVYDPNGSNNSSLLSLVAGTITFVAGETAKHGDMKVDTPVATMGIRGTAVLVEIDFSVPGTTPDAKFQVLVEPDGTTGSYILFDKVTLTPLAVVDKPNIQINVSNGLATQTVVPLSAEIQKLISDVFSLKFSDSSNTKSIEHFTDTIIPNAFGPVKLALFTTTGPTTFAVPPPPTTGPTSNAAPPSTQGHIAEAPFFSQIANGTITELANTTASKTPDKTTGTFQYFDVNTSDQTTVSASFASFSYRDANGHDITKLNAPQLADIKAVESGISVTQGGLNSVGDGTATWTYKIPDGAFDFLAAGEKLTLTFNATVDNNYQPADQTGSGTFTVTITGTNDAPVITSAQQNIEFAAAGTGTQGGSLPQLPSTTTTGTLAFADPDLTDTHTASANLVSALLNGQGIEGKAVGQALFNELAAALTASVQADSTGTGTGTIKWTLADLQVFLADFIPANESLVLTYAVTVTDSKGATSTQDVVFTIDGNNPPGSAWIDTTPLSLTNDVALWRTAANWSNDLVPDSAHNDDVLIGTDQVQPGSPTFPVTVDADASARSLTMSDFSDFVTAPELDIESNVTLTITGALNLNTNTDSGIALDPESIIKNFGHLSVGGIATLLKHSVLDNYGTITLAQGGVFGDQSSVTNSGSIELQNDTLDVEVNIANTGGILQVDDGATLKLGDGATITGGTVTVESGGSLDVDASGATLDDVTLSGSVSNSGTLTIKDTVTLDGATINGGTIADTGTLSVAASSAIENATVNGGGDIAVTTGALTLSKVTLDDVTLSGSFANSDTLTIKDTVTLDGATINGGTIADIGTLSVTASSEIENATVNGGGNLTVSSGKTLTLATVTLDNVTLAGNVSNSGTLTIDDTVTLDGTIAGGTIDVVGELDTNGTTFITGAAIINQGNIHAVSGTLTIDPTPFTNLGLFEVQGAVTFSGEDVTNSDTTNNGTIQVDQNSTLTLENSTITGGIVSNSGIIDVTAYSSIDSTFSFVNTGTVNADGAEFDLVGATIDNTGGTFKTTGKGVIDLVNSTINRGTLAGKISTADGNTSSTLNGVTLAFGTLVTAAVGVLELTGTIFNYGEVDATLGALDLENATVNGGTLGGGGTIATASGNLDSTLDGVTVASGTTLTAAVGTLDLIGITTNNGEIDATTGTLHLYNASVTGGALGGTGPISTGGSNSFSTLNNATIEAGTKVSASAGTLELTGTINNHGEIDATTGTVDLSNATIDGGTLGGSGTIVTVSDFNTFDGVTIASGTTIQVADGTILDLVGTITDHGTIELAASGHFTGLEISGNVSLTGGGAVTMTSDFYSFITSDGSAAQLSNFDTISGAGTIGDSHLTLVNSGTIDATGSHALIIDTGANFFTFGGIVGNLLVTNNVGGVLEASAGHVLQIDDNVQNDGIIQAGGVGGDSIALVSIAGGITGSGSIDIFDNGKVEVGGSVSSGQTVTFESSGGGELILDNPKDFQGLIKILVPAAAEGSENYIDLKGISYNVDMKVVPGIFDPTTDITSVTIFDGNSANSLTINVIGDYQGGDIRFADDGAGGTLISDPTIGGAATINSGSTLEIGGVSAATVSFTNDHGSSGELVLDASGAFTGQISGFAGDGSVLGSDLIDLTDVNIASVAMDKTSYTQNGNGTGTLTLYDTNGDALDHITFDGNYQLANFTIESDGDGGTLIVDPPVNTNGATPSHTAAPTDSFVFNFAGLNHAATIDFHPDHDMFQPGGPMLTNLHTASNAASDQGTLVEGEGHDHIGLSAFAKAHLHAADFHFV